jgi:phytoene/squalene synthetase
MPIYAIYGFVRVADEIVDTFHDYDKVSLLDEFQEDTFKAIKNGISTNPVLQSFQLVVNQYEIDHALIHAFLHSMRMDLTETEHEKDSYQEYIYGSAEVVGLMCLQVFCNKNQEMYENLRPAAKSLGAAFQKVNFLRDLRADYHHLGRNYFPGVDFQAFTEEDKLKIEEEIRQDFDRALTGIKELPANAKFGVYLAYIYYVRLFHKIQRTSSEEVTSARIRIPDFKKIYLLFRCYFIVKMRIL